MAVITLIAAKPGENAPGVPVETLNLWLLDIDPVFRWRQQHVAYDVYVVGQGDRIPDHGRTLDIPLSDEEYKQYLDAIASAH